MKSDRVLDCTGYLCPLPVVKTKLLIEEMKQGEILEVISDDPGAKRDFPAWCEETGNKLLKMEEEQKGVMFYIRKKGKR
ncbi:MAG: sulfurtransferase TusA family protein [Candidatus Poribacteria bacterium]